MEVHEYAFTAASVGRLALSLHQAIRNHRIALPDDDMLLAELGTVRLRKNSLGIYRLDHGAGQHDDQAIALALGTHHLLDAAAAPEWVFPRDDSVPAGDRDAFGAEVLVQRGQFAYRADAAAWSDEDDAERRIVRTAQPSPFG